MDRNPYVILGIPFGASRAEANQAFARKARAMRAAGPGNSQMTDLTWALQRISVAIRNPATAMELYRIPADPEAFQGEGPGALRPPPERLEAAAGDADAALDALRRAAAREYLRLLLAIRAANSTLPAP